MGLSTLRPNSTIQNGTDTSTVPSGTRQAVTSDDDTATYVLFVEQQPAGSQMQLGCGNLTALTAGQRVKQFRLRVRDRWEQLQPPAAAPAVVRVAALIEQWPDAVLPQTSLRYGPGQQRSTGWLRPSTVPAIGRATANIDSAVFDCRLVSHGGETEAGDPISGWRVQELYLDVDVRDRPDVTSLQVQDAAAVNRCAGTITDTTTPFVVMTGVYGYAGSPGQTVSITQQWRIFTDAQAATSGFDPWVDGVWGPPRMERITRNNVSQDGVAFTTREAFGEVDPIENGEWTIFARFGTHDFVDVNGEIWWAVESSCSWTQNFPVPPAPTVTVTPIDCPPSVELTIGAPTGSFVAPIRAEIQRSLDGGTTWVRLVDWTDDPEIPEAGSADWVDRFVQISYPADSLCGVGDAITRELLYRVRLWGAVGGAFAFTDWTEADAPVTVDPCVVVGQPCPSWVIHPTDTALDFVGAAEVWPWSTRWPYDAAQPVGGGLPSAVSGLPGGRDHTVAFLTLSTDSTVDLVAALDEPQVWLILADPALEAIWVSAGPAVTVDPQQIPSDEGAVHRVTAVTRQVAQPATSDPPPDIFET